MLWIRADGSPAIGLGHVKRCLVIAGVARRRNLDVTFVVSNENRMPLTFLREERFPFIEVPPLTDQWLDQLKDGDIVICDGYHLKDEIAAATRIPGIRVAAFDDLGEDLPPVDLLLMPSHTQQPTQRPSRTRVLTGPQIAPIAPEFVSLRRRRGDTADSLLVTLGSSDPSGLAPTVLAAIPSSSDVVLLLGPGMEDPGPAINPNFRTTRHEGNLARFFDDFDVVISAAGTTTWELLCMGIPTILVIAADNQRGVVDTAVSNGAALFGGDAQTIDSELPAALVRLEEGTCRRQLSTAALELVDGRGAGRIVETLLNY